jgi:hypothetical protein
MDILTIIAVCVISLFISVLLAKFIDDIKLFKK